MARTKEIWNDIHTYCKLSVIGAGLHWKKPHRAPWDILPVPRKYELDKWKCVWKKDTQKFQNIIAATYLDPGHVNLLYRVHLDSEQWKKGIQYNILEKMKTISSEDYIYAQRGGEECKLTKSWRNFERRLWKVMKVMKVMKEFYKRRKPEEKKRERIEQERAGDRKK